MNERDRRAPPKLPPLPASVGAPVIPPRVGLAPAAPRGVVPVAIPQMTWSSAPPPAPPRTFSTEPPPPSVVPSERLFPRRPDEETTAVVNSMRLAEEIGNEARAAVRVALDEALAPIHYRLRDIHRRIEQLEAKVAAMPAEGIAAPAPQPTPPIRAITTADAFGAPPPYVPAQAATYVPAQAAQPPPQRFALVEAHAPILAAQMPMMPVVPAPPPLPRFDDYALPSFDGARRRRKIVLLFAALFIVVFGGLLALMIASRVSST